MLMIDDRVCPFSAFEFCQNSWWAHRRPANGCKPHPFGKANALATRSYHQGRQGMAVDMLRFVVSAERMTGSAKSIKMHSTWIQMDPNGAFKDLYTVGSQWFEYYPAFGQTHDGYAMSMSCDMCVLLWVRQSGHTPSHGKVVAMVRSLASCRSLHQRMMTSSLQFLQEVQGWRCDVRDPCHCGMISPRFYRWMFRGWSSPIHHPTTRIRATKSCSQRSCRCCWMHWLCWDQGRGTVWITEMGRDR